MNEQLKIKCLAAMEELINLKLLYQIFNFAKSITTDPEQDKIKQLFWKGVWCRCDYVEETIQNEYGFRYFGEMLERFEERIGTDIKNIRALAIGFSMFDGILPDNVYVAGQRDSFIKRLEKNADDYIIDYALQIIKNGEIDTDTEFDSTEKLVLVLSMAIDFSQTFEKLKPQLTEFFGVKKNITVEDNSGIFGWLADKIYYNNIPLKKKENELFRAMLIIGNKFLKPETKEISILKKYGYSEMDISYLAFCFVSEKGSRCKIRPRTLTGERVAVDFVLKHLNGERTYTESTYQLLDYAYSQYRYFDIKCNGFSNIRDAVNDSVSVTNTYTFSLFKDKLGCCYYKHVDFFDEKWDLLNEYMLSEDYDALVVDIICDENPGKSKMRKYMSKYHKITGRKLTDIFETEYGNDKLELMSKMVRLGIIDLWTWFENAVLSENKQKMYYAECMVLGCKYDICYEFWTKFFDKYQIKDLETFFDRNKKEFISFIVDKSFHSLSNKKFGFKIFKYDLTDEQKKNYLMWAEEYFFEFRTEDYLDFIQSILLDNDVRMLISFKERKAMYDVLIKYRPDLMQDEYIREEYLTKAALEKIRRNEKRQKYKEEYLHLFKEKADFEEHFCEIYDGTFASVARFIENSSEYFYGKYKRAKIKPLFVAMSRKNRVLSGAEFTSFIKVCEWLAKRELLSFDEMKKLINGTEA